MSKDLKTFIVQKVEDGSYFKDALEWYSCRYIYPFTSRSAMLLIVIFFIFASYVMLKVTHHDYQHKQYPLPIYAEDEVLYIPKIKSISTQKEPINISVARYLSSKYVTFREGYNPNDFIELLNKEVLLKKIKALSSKKIFNDYQNFMNPDINPDSPIIFYKGHTQRIISIKNVEFKGHPFNPDYAIVTYEAYEKTKASNTKTQWKAEVDFMMSDIGQVFDKKVPLKFIVTRYRTYKL